MTTIPIISNAIPENFTIGYFRMSDLDLSSPIMGEVRYTIVTTLNYAPADRASKMEGAASLVTCLSPRTFAWAISVGDHSPMDSSSSLGTVSMPRTFAWTVSVGDHLPTIRFSLEDVVKQEEEIPGERK